MPGLPARHDALAPCPDLRVNFAAPVYDATGANVVFNLEGYPPDALSAGAVIQFAFPWIGTWLRSGPGRSGPSVALTDVTGDRATLGWVNLGRPESLSGVYYEPHDPAGARPGREHGGILSVSHVEFSGLDGVKLLAAPGPRRWDSRASTATLGEARPNPFSGSTQFDLTLDRATSVTLACTT